MAEFVTVPSHGGDLIRASQKYNIALSDWLDLSTGLNPDGYPIPSVPEEYYRRLPLPGDDRLCYSARHYFHCKHLVAASGSQQFIQLLPTLRSKSSVAIPDVGYQEHYYHWKKNGHTIVHYCAWKPEAIGALLDSSDVNVVVLINPSNPTAVSIDTDYLLSWQKILHDRGGWLIIDEAFADSSPEKSFATLSDLPGVIVLRSLGKFFGLAGLRVGFALSDESLNKKIAGELGPWCVSGPAQYIATEALSNEQWHSQARELLATNSQWMCKVLHNILNEFHCVIAMTDYFVSVKLDAVIAKKIVELMAEKGILIRYWPLSSDDGCEDHFPTEKKSLLRFGLISERSQELQQRFQSSLQEVVSSLHMFSMT